MIGLIVTLVIIVLFASFARRQYVNRAKISIAPEPKSATPAVLNPKLITMLKYIKNFGISGKQCTIDIRQSGDYYISDGESMYKTGILNNMQRMCVDKILSMQLRDSYRNVTWNPLGADSNVSRLIIGNRTIVLGTLSLDCVPRDLLEPVLVIDRIITGPLVGVNWSESRQKFPIINAGAQ